jgi:hypothetical protein
MVCRRYTQVMAAVVVLAGCEAGREIPPASGSAANQTATVVASTASGPGSKEIMDACDSAASFAIRVPRDVIRVVRDTAFADFGVDSMPAERGCAVLIRHYPNPAGTSNKLFWKGFPGASWTLNEYDAVDSDSVYGVFRGHVLCEIHVRPSTGTREQHTVGFDIFCHSD